MSPEKDVIVVGAGFGGATAARELSTRGLSVLLLEARDRIGGRTCTSALSDGELVELGGTYIGWLQPHVWAEISRYGLGDDVIDGGEPLEYALTPQDGGLAWSSAAEQAARERDLLSRFWGESREVMPRPFAPLHRRDVVAERDCWSIADRLDQLDLSPGDRSFLEAFFTTHTGLPAADSSYLAEMRWWAPAAHDHVAMEENVFGYRLRNGTVSLLSAILADGGAELRLDSPVEAIVTEGETVHVTTAAGEMFQARAVVVAVPSGVWPHLRFDPPLPADRVDAAREGMQIHHVSKGYAVVRNEPRRLSALPIQPHPISMITTSRVRSQDEQVIVYWGTDLLKDPTDADEVGAAFRDLLPDAHVVEVAARAYTIDDPYTRGGWGVLKKGQLTRFAPHHDFLRPEGRIAFAGADIAAGWHGFIDGAIETGIVAARQVRELLANGGEHDRAV